MRRHVPLSAGLATATALTLLAGQVCAADLSTYIGAGSTLCEYSSGWQLSTVPNPFSGQIAFATQLGDSLRVKLPKNTSSITYIGYKDTAPALFSACLDCDGVNQANRKEVFVKYNGTTSSGGTAAPFFSFRDLNPAIPHIFTATNLWDSSLGAQARTSFAGLIIAIVNGTVLEAPGAPPSSPGQGDSVPSVTPSVSPSPSSSSSAAQTPTSLSSTTPSVTSRPNDWAASSTSPPNTASRTNSLPAGALPSTLSSGQQPGPTTTPGSAAGSDHKGLSTGLIALIAVLATLGGLSVAVLAGVLVWRKRNTGSRGMLPLGDNDHGSSMAAIEPYFLTTSDAAAITSDRAGRPSSPNFFAAQPFGAQDGWTSRPSSIRIVQPAAEQNPFVDDAGVEEVPRRQTSSPASPWLLRTPRDSFSSTR
ncbi:hypothetical protein PsYK624_020560 [Phanerochaete sordida]|uniref:Uncharacterized protein n=1 Tax=Phanerochaete sordida TaxID=48140 RepID=A0A9P3L8D3_9APHY|nr:hypothetical protein PsYK624_020560 [Phanerochaete sordida]